MTKTAQVVDAHQAEALATLRKAASDWSTAEFDCLRRQGLDYWSTKEPGCFIHWEMPLVGDPAGTQAHLTLQLADPEYTPPATWSLVWQVEIVETGRWGRVVDQTELACIDLSTRPLQVDESVDALLSIEPAQVLAWARQKLLLRGYEMAFRPRA